jgi:RecA/RadA recombinase
MASEGGGHFKLLGPAELDDLPEPSWLIEGVLPANALGVLYGASGVGKTFVALSMALSIAAGHSWCGKATKSAAVLYVAAEGLFGLRLRVQAYQRRYGIRAEHIRYLGDAFDLRRAIDIEKLTLTLQAADFRPDLIVLDTLARLIPGAEENSSKDMGEAIRAIDGLRRAFQATVLLIHHTGKNGELERGSGALRGAADVMIKCSASGERNLVPIKCEKMKESEPFPSATIALERYKIDDSRASLAVSSLIAAAEKETDCDGALAILEAKFGLNGATHGEWLHAYSHDTGRSKSTFVRAVNKLKQDHAVRVKGRKYYSNGTIDGVRFHEVSKECHDTSHVGVMSSPLLGDDTDTTAIGQK